MVVLNYAKARTALLLGGSVLNNDNSQFPTYFMIGSGSGTIASTDTTLFNVVDRQEDTSVVYDGQTLTWTGDWNFTEMSGLSLTEFGKTTSGTGLIGSVWSKTTLPTTIFDGTAELRIEETWSVY